MEKEAARRRIHMISGHFTARDEIPPAAHLLPMNCSGSLNSVIRRYDGSVYFARQGSDSQGCFMRQASTEQGSYTQSGIPPKRHDSSCTESCNSSKEPLFSRPLGKELNFPRVSSCRSEALDTSLTMLEPPPQFARPSKRIYEEERFHHKKVIYTSESNAVGWSPKMDVAESGRSYVITVEIPGVNTDDIRVEIDNQNLTITGNRSNVRAMSFASEPFFSYQRREISIGPYKLVWPLPANVNRESVSAEFWDGFLQITIPKF